MSNPRLHPDQILKRLPRFTSALVVFFNAKQTPAPSLNFWHSPHQLPFPPKKRTGRRKGRVRNVLESHLELSKEHSVRGREPQCVVRDCGWAACTQQGMRRSKSGISLRKLVGQNLTLVNMSIWKPLSLLPLWDKSIPPKDTITSTGCSHHSLSSTRQSQRSPGTFYHLSKLLSCLTLVRVS